MRWAVAVVAACALSIAAADSSADEAAPQAGSSPPLRLRLATDKTYLYRLRESIVVRQSVEVGALGQLPIEQRSEIVWDAGVTLQRVDPSGDVVVSLMPTRVRGSLTQPAGKAEPFDSDDPKAPVSSPLLGRGILVTLSPAGRVRSATGPETKLKNVAAVEGGLRTRLLQFDATIAKPFAQQFFHELPDAAPRAALTWDQTRSLAPGWVGSASVVFGHVFGDAEERSTVKTIATDTVGADVRARGNRDARRSDKPADLGSVTPEDAADLGEQLEEWLVLGEVRVRRDTGLVESRTASTTLSTHANALRLPKEKLPAIPGLPPGDVVAPASDRTYEITLQLDLVDVR